MWCECLTPIRIKTRTVVCFTQKVWRTHRRASGVLGAIWRTKGQSEDDHLRQQPVSASEDSLIQLSSRPSDAENLRKALQDEPRKATTMRDAVEGGPIGQNREPRGQAASVCMDNTHMPCAPEPVASLETQLHALTIRAQLDQPMVDATRHAPAVVAASTLPWPSQIPQAQTDNFVAPLSSHPQGSRSRRTSPSDAPAAAAAPQLHLNSGTLQES